MGLGGPQRGKSCPYTVLFKTKRLKGRQLYAVAEALGRVGDHSGEEAAAVVAAVNSQPPPLERRRRRRTPPLEG